MELPLQTQRLIVRTLVADDATTIAAYRDDPAVSKYQDWPLPYSDDDARRSIERQAGLSGPTAGTGLNLGVDLDGTLIGDVYVGLDDAGKVASVGYTFVAEHHGHGYATEALAAVVDALVADGVHRFVASLDPLNVPSMRVLEAVGFTFESL